MCFSRVFATATMLFVELFAEIIILLPCRPSLIPAALNVFLFSALLHLSASIFPSMLAETPSGNPIIFSNFFIFSLQYSINISQKLAPGFALLGLHMRNDPRRRGDNYQSHIPCGKIALFIFLKAIPFHRISRLYCPAFIYFSKKLNFVYSASSIINIFIASDIGVLLQNAQYRPKQLACRPYKAFLLRPCIMILDAYEGIYQCIRCHIHSP